MPWTPEQFRSRHNKKLTLPQAKHAATQAEAMMARGVPEGEAIATANKYARPKGPGAVPKRKGKK